MRGSRSRIRGLLDEHLVVGTLILVMGAIVLYISYTALSGFPWTPSYSITADVPDAGQLSKNADVRVGGARIGQVLKIEAEPRRGRLPPRARLHLKLNTKDTPLPVDTTAEVRIGSVLGSKYLAIVPGHSKREIPEGGRLPLAQASSTVGVDEAFDIFGPKSRNALRKAITTLAEGLAGRGTAVNETVGNTRRLLPGLQRVLAMFAAQRTDLGGFVRGARAATGAVAPVAAELGALIGYSSTTLGALDSAGNSLGDSIETFPSTAGAARRALRSANPVLTDLAAISRDLRPAADELPATLGRLDPLVRKATAVGPRVARLSSPLQRTFRALGAFTSNPASRTSLRLLGTNDLATFGASAFVGLGAILATVYEAERGCGVASSWVRNLRSISPEGDSSGNWLRMIPILKNNEALASGKPSPDLHANPYPNENSRECEAGNEPFRPGQQIGNPPGLQRKP
jgi:virulence factor Mce-like protein